MGFYSGRTILITGSCGTVGSELVKNLIFDKSLNVKRIIGIDNNESQIFFQASEYAHESSIQFFVCDIRDKDALSTHFRDVDIVFHCAALKHVILNEYSPEQAISTNVIGVQNVIKSCVECNVERLIFTSSDKAVNPTNVMGTSKLMGERLITAANNHHANSKTIFSSTRFGNVLGSNGSVIEIFKKQIISGGPLTITDKSMSRFVMSAKQAADLVIRSAEIAKGGEVFITKMPVLNIQDLAETLVSELAPLYSKNVNTITYEYIGSKPGEKLYEELMTDEETKRALELESYFSVLPAFRSAYSNRLYQYDDLVSNNVIDPYVSKNQIHLSQVEIKNLLYQYGLLGEVN